MRKLPPFVALGLCLLLAGCQTPLFSDGMFGSLSPRKTLTAQKATSETTQTDSSSGSRVGGRGWRNAASRAAEQESQSLAIGTNNVGRLREFLAKGNDAMQKGQYDDARIQYETVLSLEPQHATAHHMLGRISDMSRNFDEAERHYLAALSANREDGYLLSDLGYSYLQQGRLDEARQYLTQAITREPNLGIAKVNLAAVYAYGGDERGSLAWLRQVGSEQQAQETLASITSKPAPWVVNGAAGMLAEGPDKYSVNKDGQVLDANGQQLKTWEEVQTAMKHIREQGSKTRGYEVQLQEFQERERIKRAMAQESGADPRGRNVNSDENLNRQMQAIEQASGNARQTGGNSQPMYVGPPDNASAPRQLPPAAYNGAAPQSDWNSQGQIQQYQPGSPQDQYATQQDQYSGLLNPAGPTGFQQQPGYQNQQLPQRQPTGQGSTVPPQFPGTPQFQGQPPGYQGVAPTPQQPQQQYRDPGYGPNQHQGVEPGYPPNQRQPPLAQPSNGNFGTPAINPASQQYPDQNAGQFQRREQQPPPASVPVDQYGYPIQQSSPTNPAWNGQPANQPLNQGSTAPNPNYFGQGLGQGNSPGRVNSQEGMYVGNPSQISPQFLPQQPTEQVGQYPVGNSPYQQNQSTPAHYQQNGAQYLDGRTLPQQQVQQLSFDSQPPMARIDRGQRIRQYSEADRQAMQLGMAAGFGAFSPIVTSQTQTPQLGQPPQNNAPQNSGPQNYGSPGDWQQPGNPRRTAVDSGFSYDQQPGQRTQPEQFSPQTQQLPDRAYPGAVPATSGQLPGQANNQFYDQSFYGQTAADQATMNPQTQQHWLNMPTSQADVTMPVAFSSSTQPTQQQSQNWQRPELANQTWQDGIHSSPTTRPEFGQPHMTDPYLRAANTESGQQPGDQAAYNLPGNQNASWGLRQPAAGSPRN